MNATKVLAGLLLELLLAGAVCQAQQSKLSQERAKRLSIGGCVESTATKLYPVQPSVGEIISVVVRSSIGGNKVKALRLHFEVNAETLIQKGQADAWRVVFSNLAGETIWEFESKTDVEADEFWTPEMRGDSVLVRVFSDVPNSALKLLIDRKIECLEPIQEKSIVGDDDTIEITKADSRSKEWGRSVARLTFISDEDDEAAYCTGFLISSNLFITNEHCPRSKKEKRFALVEFDYDSQFARTKIFRLQRELLRDEDLDFAIYALNKPVTDRAFLKLKDDDQNLKNQKQLFVIQHPAGLPKRLASHNCQIKTTTSALDPPSDFGHECDTQGGSSGSPVQDVAGMVVGLHHFGFGESANPALLINQAVKMGAILTFIKTKDESLFRTLTNSQ